MKIIGIIESITMNLDHFFLQNDNAKIQSIKNVMNIFYNIY